MPHYRRLALVLFCALAGYSALAADWRQFRGPGGLGTSAEKGLPIEWSSQKNIVWKTKLPGPGGSSPVTVGKRVYLTCYTGYALNPKQPGQMADLRRHLLCLDRDSGKIRWTKEFLPVLPEHKYQGEGSYHGYSSSTPVTDGEHLYVFFGKSGVFCFDLNGKERWHVLVGTGIDRWGSGASPLLYKDLLIVNASVESGSLVALDKRTGKEVWRAPKTGKRAGKKGWQTPRIGSAWNTPVLVTAPSGERELAISIQNWILAFNPDTGEELWHAEGVHRYVCPSVIAHDGVVYAIGGGHTSLAVKAGGRGDVTKTHVLWRKKKGSNVSSPVYHNGYLYWANDHGGLVNCQDATTGEFLYQQRLAPDPGIIYASPVLVEGRLYYVSQHRGTFVVAAQPKFALLAHNVIADDKSRTNASPAVSDGQLLLRSDEYAYCIGKQ